MSLHAEKETDSKLLESDQKLDESQPKQPAHLSLRSIAFMNLYCVLFVSYAAGARIAKNEFGVGVMDISLWRAITLMAISLPSVIKEGFRPWESVSAELRPTLVKRSVYGQIAFLCYNYAVTVLPFSTIFVIVNTSPFFTSLFGYFINKEHIFYGDVIGIVVCFTAVLLIAYGKQEEDAPEASLLTYHFGLAAISTTAVGFSLVGVLTRKMKSLSSSLILYWYSLFGLITLGCYIFLRDLTNSDPSHIGFFEHSWEAMGVTLASCIVNAAGQFCFAEAFKGEKSGKIVLFVNMTIVYGFLLDILLFNIDFNAFELIGALVILATSVSITVAKLFGSQKK